MYCSSQLSEAHVISGRKIEISMLPGAWPVSVALSALLKCFMIYLLIAVPKANAGEKQIPVFLAPAHEASKLDSLFAKEIEVAFIDLGVSLTDTRVVIDSLNNKNSLNDQGALFDKFIEHFTINGNTNKTVQETWKTKLTKHSIEQKRDRGNSIQQKV